MTHACTTHNKRYAHPHTLCAESPQWRRGPCAKPILCNACGTRYRRTNQLGVAIPSYMKDKSRSGTPAPRKRGRAAVAASSDASPSLLKSQRVALQVAA
jgi:hypothetical protein